MIWIVGIIGYLCMATVVASTFQEEEFSGYTTYNLSLHVRALVYGLLWLPVLIFGILIVIAVAPVSVALNFIAMWKPKKHKKKKRSKDTW